MANADALATPGGLEFPDCVSLAWRNDFVEFVRTNILAALLTGILAKPRDDWNEGDINFFMLQLDLIRRTDPSASIQHGALEGLHALLSAWPPEPGDQLPAPWGEISTENLRTEVESLVNESYSGVPAVSSLAERLRIEWGQT